MEAVIAEVRAKSRGEIVVVTLPDLGDRAASDVALQIGRQWGVGAKGAAGDPTKNLGVVVLLVPLKTTAPVPARCSSRRAAAPRGSSPTRGWDGSAMR